MTNKSKSSTFDQAIEEKVTTKTMEFEWYDEKILRINILDGADFDLGETRVNLNILSLITRERRYCQLVDARSHWNASKEARTLAVKPDVKKNIIARAIIVESISSRLFAHFFIKFSHAQSNTKIFHSEGKAIEWLNGQK